MTEDQLKLIVEYTLGRAADIADSLAHHPIAIASEIRNGVERVTAQVIADATEAGIWPPATPPEANVDTSRPPGGFGHGAETIETVHDVDVAAANEPDPAPFEGAVTEV